MKQGGRIENAGSGNLILDIGRCYLMLDEQEVLPHESPFE